MGLTSHRNRLQGISRSIATRIASHSSVLRLKHDAQGSLPVFSFDALQGRGCIIHSCCAQANSRQKRKIMKTFIQMRTDLLQALVNLRHLEGPGTVKAALRLLQERETGKLCYQAEEDLPQSELSLLKDMLSVQKSRWETYKQRCREGMPALGE